MFTWDNALAPDFLEQARYRMNSKKYIYKKIKKNKKNADNDERSPDLIMFSFVDYGTPFVP